MNHIWKEAVSVSSQFRIGSRFIGSYDEDDNLEFTSIEYFVILNLPFVPLGSYRVHAVEDEPVILGSYVTKYLVSKIPMQWKRIIPVLGTVYGMIVLLVLLFWITIAAQNGWLRILGVCVIIFVVAYGLVRLSLAEQDQKD